MFVAGNGGRSLKPPIKPIAKLGAKIGGGIDHCSWLSVSVRDHCWCKRLLIIDIICYPNIQE